MLRVVLLSAVPALVAVGAGAAPSLERGEYLVTGPAACGNCHTPLGPHGLDMTPDLGGRLVEENPMFTAYAPNITPAGRIADWSDDELAARSARGSGRMAA